MGLILFINSDLLPSAALPKAQICCANDEGMHSGTSHHKYLITFFLELHIAPGYRWNNNDSKYRIIVSF